MTELIENIPAPSPLSLRAIFTYFSLDVKSLSPSSIRSHPMGQCTTFGSRVVSQYPRAIASCQLVIIGVVSERVNSFDIPSVSVLWKSFPASLATERVLVYPLTRPIDLVRHPQHIRPTKTWFSRSWNQ